MTILQGAASPLGTIRRRQLKEGAIELGVTLVALTGIAAVVLIFVFVAREALPLFSNPELAKETDLGRMFLPQVWRAGRRHYTWQPCPQILIILSALKGHSAAMSVSGGIAGHLLRAAPPAARGARRSSSSWLVVLGFFALGPRHLAAGRLRLHLPTPSPWPGWRHHHPGVHERRAHGAGQLPRASLRWGPWETAFRVVLPAAAPGVLAAVVLGFGRAIGETMIVLMASGNAAQTTWSFGDSIRTLPATIAAEMGEVVFGGGHYAVLFFIGIELFVFTFILNSMAAIIVRRLVRRMSGAGA
jgi:phosphate transport system permease protein